MSNRPFLIFLSPIRCDGGLVLSRAGECLVVNGQSLDFAALAEGASLPAAGLGCDWLVSDVSCEGGAIRLTLLLPHGATAPRAVLFPEQLEVAADGPVALPH